MPPIRRTLKNVVKNYSDAQIKVREATSNDPWGPSSTLKSEVSDLTYNVVAFTDIMQMIWKRLNDDGKNWRHVYKALELLEYIIKTGSEKVAQQCKENFHAIKTLTSFQHTDIDNKDQGKNVREKAKLLVGLLSDDDRLKNERAKAIKAKERFAQNSSGMGNAGPTPAPAGKVRLGRSTPDANMTNMTTRSDSFGNGTGYNDSSPSSGGNMATDMENARPSSPGEEERQLQLALALSREEHNEEVKKLQSDELKLQMALEQSKHANATKSQADSLLDLSANSTAANQAAAPPSTDPWGMPLGGGTRAQQPAEAPKDPWGAPIPAPPPAHPAAASNPWGGQNAASPLSRATPPAVAAVVGASAVAVDPWGVPVASARATPPAVTVPNQHIDPWVSGMGGGDKPTGGGVQLDAFGAPVAVATTDTNPNTTLDSEFDMLSARSTEGSPAKPNTKAAMNEFDLLAGGGTNRDAWNMGGLHQNLPDPSRRKSPEDFLGANAALVNLDQLVTSAPAKGNNPFATPAPASTTNPFQSMGGGQSTGVMTQMAPGYPAQPVHSAILPAPLMPLNPASQPQNTAYNPFL